MTIEPDTRKLMTNNDKHKKSLKFRRSSLGIPYSQTNPLVHSLYKYNHHKTAYVQDGSSTVEPVFLPEGGSSPPIHCLQDHPHESKLLSLSSPSCKILLLVGGDLTILKNMSSSNGKDDIPYIMENNPNVWNHQPAFAGITQFGDFFVTASNHFLSSWDKPPSNSCLAINVLSGSADQKQSHGWAVAANPRWLIIKGNYTDDTTNNVFYNVLYTHTLDH